MPKLSLERSKGSMFCPCAANWLFVILAYISILRVFLITSMLVSLVLGCSRERKLTLFGNALSFVDRFSMLS